MYHAMAGVAAARQWLCQAQVKAATSASTQELTNCTGNSDAHDRDRCEPKQLARAKEDGAKLCVPRRNLFPDSYWIKSQDQVQKQEQERDQEQQNEACHQNRIKVRSPESSGPDAAGAIFERCLEEMRQTQMNRLQQQQQQQQQQPRHLDQQVQAAIVHERVMGQVLAHARDRVNLPDETHEDGEEVAHGLGVGVFTHLLAKRDMGSTRSKPPAAGTGRNGAGTGTRAENHGGVASLMHSLPFLLIILVFAGLRVKPIPDEGVVHALDKENRECFDCSNTHASKTRLEIMKRKAKMRPRRSRQVFRTIGAQLKKRKKRPKSMATHSPTGGYGD